MTLPIKTATAGSIVGVFVVVYFMFADVQSTTLRLVLWPASIIGSGYDGGEKVLDFLIGTLELAGNSILYGIVGWLLGRIAQLGSRKQRR
jgi:hypothetical protein